MDLVLLFAAGVVTMLCLTDYGSEDAQFLGCILALCWVGSNIAYMADAIHFGMATDLAVACAAYWVWKNNHIGWRTTFLVLSVYQLVADAVFDCSNWTFYEQWARASNVIFTLQLIALLTMGAVMYLIGRMTRHERHKLRNQQAAEYAAKYLERRGK